MSHSKWTKIVIRSSLLKKTSTTLNALLHLLHGRYLGAGMPWKRTFVLPIFTRRTRSRNSFNLIDRRIWYMPFQPQENYRVRHVGAPTLDSALFETWADIRKRFGLTGTDQRFGRPLNRRPQHVFNSTSLETNYHCHVQRYIFSFLPYSTRQCIWWDITGRYRCGG